MFIALYDFKNVLPTSEVKSSVLQSYKRQVKLQGKLLNDQNIGINNKHLYFGGKDSIIASESQYVNTKVDDTEHGCTNNTNSPSKVGLMGPGDKASQHKRVIGVKNNHHGDKLAIH